MIKLYKDELECMADESQLADMKAAGWLTDKPKNSTTTVAEKQALTQAAAKSAKPASSV